MALSENEMSENANVGDTFEYCDKGKKRNRKVVGGRCGSRRFFFLNEDSTPYFTNGWVILCNRKSGQEYGSIQIG